jgi:hypothetical protein
MKAFAIALLGCITAGAQEIFKSDKATDEPRCKILSLSGGGSKGAFEVGAVHQMVSMLD